MSCHQFRLRSEYGTLRLAVITWSHPVTLEEVAATLQGYPSWVSVKASWYLQPGSGRVVITSVELIGEGDDVRQDLAATAA